MNSYRESAIKLELSKNSLRNSWQNLQGEGIIILREGTEYGNARDIVNSVLSATQEQVKSYIEEIATLALQAVFGETFALAIDCEQKRGKSEFNLKLVKSGVKFDLRDEVGGGALDVVSFALRIALWSMRFPRSSSLFVLDEPGTAVSEDLRPKFGEMLRKLSETLGIQLIIISHDSALQDIADRVFTVTQENEVSTVSVED